MDYELPNYELFSIGLTAPQPQLYKRIDQRVLERIVAGAAKEDPVLAADPTKWKFQEHKIARQQITWFKKQPNLTWFDITIPGWDQRAEKIIRNWYNNHHVPQS